MLSNESLLAGAEVGNGVEGSNAITYRMQATCKREEVGCAT